MFFESNELIEAPYPMMMELKHVFRLTKITILVIAGIFIASCSASTVIQYIDEEADFKNYHTFKIINYKNDNKEYSSEGNAFVDSIEFYIDSQMRQRAYEVEVRPDLMVRYELISGVESEVDYSNSNFYGGRTNFNQFNNPYYYGPRETRHIEGILLLEIKERKTKKLVWQGSLDLKYSKKKKDSNLGLMQDAITEIFTTYPYMAGRSQPIQP
ncbi:MAG: hypothetical protein ACJA2S_000437 [Cyclobacteriaceae bacterium]